MRLTRIFTPQILELDKVITLEGSSANHLLRVLRLKIEDPILVFDGRGSEFYGVICGTEKQKVNVLLKTHLPPLPESPLNIHLGQAVSRGEKMDLTLQKAVELGVKGITPLWSRYTGVSLSGERLTNKLEHWQKIVVSSCEQSGRSFLPTLNPAQNVSNWLTEVKETLKLLLDPKGEMSLNTIPPSHSICLLVGPEGGFSEEEIIAGKQAGFQTIQLGPRILRTETAAPAMIAMLQCLWGDMG